MTRHGWHDSWLGRWWPTLALLLALAVLAATFAYSHHRALEKLQQAQTVAVASRVQTLESVLSRQRAVATVLSDDSTVRQALTDPGTANRAAVSLKLDRLRDQTESAVLYLLDTQGIAIAASNYDEAQSFVGQNYSFRDYFTDALLRGEATQFALGTVSNRPGLYLSHDVIGEGRTLGVVVVKVEFDRIERNWADSVAQTHVLDGEGQVILSSVPRLRFAPLPRLGAAMVRAQAPVPGTDWVMIVQTSAAPATYGALWVTGTAGFGLMLLAVGAGMGLRARRNAARRAEAEQRYRSDLEYAVVARTRELSQEISERRAAETRLGQLQADMVQASKLAALGQITAGVAHEVNQPLATIRLLAETGAAMLPAGQAPDVAENLSTILRMTERITKITQQLRGFARKATGHVGPVALAEAMEAALLLTATQREARNIALDLPAIPADLRVMGEPVRLEQILVNLLQNAQEALAATPAPRITLALQSGDRVQLSISDNGPGISDAIAAQLFMPFATSKPQGLGLGLVISQDIARDFGGNLTAAPVQPGQGARFILELSVAV